MKISFYSILFSSLILSTVSFAATGKAIIKGTNPSSDLYGVVTLEDTKKGLLVKAEVKNVAPGDHGFHIHQFGSCEKSGKAAGGHYNPKGKKHGLVTKDGLTKAHGGDLGNLTVGPNGQGQLQAIIKGLKLSKGKYSVAGRAFILHDKPDDFGQPTGNAGARIGCGPIVLTGE